MRETITSSPIALLAGPAGERLSLWLEGMKMTKADQPPRKARKRPQTATDDEAEEGTEPSQETKRSHLVGAQGSAWQSCATCEQYGTRP